MAIGLNGMQLTQLAWLLSCVHSETGSCLALFQSARLHGLHTWPALEYGRMTAAHLAFFLKQSITGHSR